jgi:hypothetical protein
MDMRIAAEAEERRHLESQCRDAERQASADLMALSARLFIHPTLHDGLRTSVSFRQWCERREHARQLRERLDACTLHAQAGRHGRCAEA